MSGYPKEAYYTLKSKKYGIGFKLNWEGNLFKYNWLWQERFVTKDFPWWGQCYTVTLEPWTSAWTSDPENAIHKGDWLHFKAGEVVETQLSASII